MIRLFINRFLFSALLVVLMLIAGIGSYQYLIQYFEVSTEANTENVEKGVQGEEEHSEASIDTVSKNMIFVLNDKDEIVALLVEILDGYHETLTYTTIPVDASFTMSSGMYQKMISLVPTVPQILKLEKLNQYFNQQNWAHYASILMEDVIGEKVSYYTILREEDFLSWFAPVSDGSGEVIYELSQPFYETIKNIQTKEDLAGYIKSNYEKLTSNLDLDHKLMYLDVYCSLHRKDITFRLIDGKRDAKQYRIERTTE